PGGTPGAPGAGFPQGMDPTAMGQTDPAIQQERVSQAAQIGQSLGVEPGATRKVSPADQEAHAKRLEKADGNQLEALAKDPKFLAAASPQTKAKLMEKLQNSPCGGIGGAERGQMALDLLKSCKSKDEYDQMVNSLGGKKKVEDLLKDGNIRK